MRQKSLWKSVWILLLFAGVISCTDDPAEVVSGQFENGVVIVNEGSFGSNDGELYHFDPLTGQVTANLFESVNNRPFAGLIQQVRPFGNYLYIVANTGKVEIVNAADFLSIGSVTGGELNIPRDLVALGSKLFISDFGPYDENWNSPESFVAVVSSLEGGSISSTIPVPSAPEGLAEIGGKVWVACTGARQLAVIDPHSETIDTLIDIPNGAPYFFFQFEGSWFVYALSESEIHFHRINFVTNTLSETKSFPIAGAIYNGNFALAENGTVYVISAEGATSNVVKLSLSTGTVLDADFFSGTNFYGLSYDLRESQLYIGDNAGWQGNGRVWIVDEQGNPVSDFGAGRGPSGFLFVR